MLQCCCCSLHAIDTSEDPTARPDTKGQEAATRGPLHAIFSEPLPTQRNLDPGEDTWVARMNVPQSDCICPLSKGEECCYQLAWHSQLVGFGILLLSMNNFPEHEHQARPLCVLHDSRQKQDQFVILSEQR